jgi:hypothetical protein
MTEPLPWDWPPTLKYRRRRRPRVEGLPPADEDEPRRVRAEVTIHHHHRRRQFNPQSIVVMAAIAFAVIMVVRFPLGLLLLPILLGREIVLTGLFVVALLAVIAVFNRWRGRHF